MCWWLKIVPEEDCLEAAGGPGPFPLDLRQLREGCLPFWLLLSAVFESSCHHQPKAFVTRKSGSLSGVISRGALYTLDFFPHFKRNEKEEKPFVWELALSPFQL